MATKKRPGSAKRTLAKQEAARKRGAPGKRFIGETAGQVAKAKRDERKKVARMARAARPAEAARTAGPKKRPSTPRKAARPSEPTLPESEAAFRAAEQDAAEHGAEVEPLERAEPLLRAVPAPEQHEGEHDAARLREAAAEIGATPYDWGASSDPDERSAERAANATTSDGATPLGFAMSDLLRSALGLVRTLVAVPFRIALAVPRLALRAVFGSSA